MFVQVCREFQSRELEREAVMAKILGVGVPRTREVNAGPPEALTPVDRVAVYF